METKQNAADEKARTWRLLEKIIGNMERVVNHRADWRVHRQTDISVLVTFSKAGHSFYDVSKNDLEQFATYKRAFFVFLAGSHKDAFIVSSQELRAQVKTQGLIASQEYGDYKLHLVRDYRGTYFREIPNLNLTPFLNQYAQLI